jgi:phosphatidate phosphatase LPIN
MLLEGEGQDQEYYDNAIEDDDYEEESQLEGGGVRLDDQLTPQPEKLDTDAEVITGLKNLALKEENSDD